MNISNNIIKHYLRNAYFINGTAYAGKSTMVKMLSEEYGLIMCGENYHDVLPDGVLVPRLQPNLCYFQTMSGWREFVSRTPEEYDAWIQGVSKEAAEIEIMELCRLGAEGKRLIVDTNISLDILHEITEYDHVAIMLSPESLSVDRFFDREDPEKQFLKKQLMLCPDPEKALENYRACLTKINGKEHYDEFANSGFFTITRENNGKDTRRETMLKLAAHFGFIK